MKIVAQEAVTESRDPGAAANADPTDAMLVKRVRDGDPSAYELLVRRHQAALFRRARWMGFEPDTAADMVQDALIKAYESLASCRDPNRFLFWAGQILRNKCLDFLKSAARRGVPLSLELPAEWGNPEVEHERSALRDQLKQALAALPEEQREAFLMKHGEDLSYEEMAELTGASVSAMKMRVHRARELLQVELGSFFGA
jgi:RNA polymerase sigma-70 factor (ECF subfamily)